MKIDNTRALGAEVVLYDRAGGEDRDAIGARLSAERGLTLIKPFDEPEVIAGQGTVGLEIAAQAAEVGVTEADVLVCCGGGGLTSGIAMALEARAPGLQGAAGGARGVRRHGAVAGRGACGAEREALGVDLRRDRDAGAGEDHLPDHAAAVRARDSRCRTRIACGPWRRRSSG